MSWEDLNYTLHGLYPEYQPGIISLKDFDINEAYENCHLLTDIHRQQIPELFLLKGWISKLNTAIIDYNENYDSNSEDENYSEILEELDEFK